MHEKLNEFKHRVTINANKGVDIIKDAKAIRDKDIDKSTLANVEKVIKALIRIRDEQAEINDEMEELLLHDSVMTDNGDNCLTYRQDMSNHMDENGVNPTIAEIEEQIKLLKEFAELVPLENVRGLDKLRGEKSAKNNGQSQQFNGDALAADLVDDEVIFNGFVTDHQERNDTEAVQPTSGTSEQPCQRRDAQTQQGKSTAKDVMNRLENMMQIQYQLMKKLHKTDADEEVDEQAFFRELREAISGSRCYAEGNGGPPNHQEEAWSTYEDGHLQASIANEKLRLNYGIRTSSTGLEAQPHAASQTFSQGTFQQKQQEVSSVIQDHHAQQEFTQLSTMQPHHQGNVQMQRPRNGRQLQSMPTNNMMQYPDYFQQHLQMGIPTHQQGQFMPVNQFQQSHGQDHIIGDSRTNGYGSHLQTAKPFEHNIQPPRSYSSPHAFGNNIEEMKLQMKWEKLKHTAKTAAATTLTPFNGDVTEWPAFINQFDAEVHLNPVIDIPSKQMMLMKLLPRNIAWQHQMGYANESTYMLIRNNLDRQFNRPKAQKILTYNQLEDIDFPEDNLEDLTSALNAYSTFAYKNSVYGSNPNDDLSLTRLLHKLPPKIRAAVHKKYENGAPTLHALMDAAHDAVSFQQCLALHGNSSTKKSNGISSTTVNVTSNNDYDETPTERYGRPDWNGRKEDFIPPSKMIPCKYCRSDQHAAIECRRTIKKKIQAIRAKNLCFNCLSDKHQVNECRSKYGCFNCHERHFTAHCSEIPNHQTINAIGYAEYYDDDKGLEQQLLFQKPGAKTPKF